MLLFFWHGTGKKLRQFHGDWIALAKRRVGGHYTELDDAAAGGRGAKGSGRGKFSRRIGKDVAKTSRALEANVSVGVVFSCCCCCCLFALFASGFVVVCC